MQKFNQLVEDQVASINYNQMAVSIVQVADDHITVNNKSVKKDMNNNWITTEELTPAETTTFNGFVVSSNNKIGR